MSEVREKLIKQAMLYIDEVSPDNNEHNTSFFPIVELLDEAARWAIRIVPQYWLGAGKEIPKEQFSPEADGSGSLTLPTDFIRLLRFRMKGWLRPVLQPIYDTNPKYVQQFNETLRGGIAKPVVVICENESRLEYYSSPLGVTAKIVEARYFGFTAVDNEYPPRLHAITAWKAAELVLAVMNDTSAMQLCQARIQEILTMP